jgi:hypothetical protein
VFTQARVWKQSGILPADGKRTANSAKVERRDGGSVSGVIGNLISPFGFVWLAI